MRESKETLNNAVEEKEQKEGKGIREQEEKAEVGP
jgi:hypothetical protein